MHCVDVVRGGLLPDTRCQHLSRPGSEQYCDSGPCVMDVWMVGQWGMVRATLLSNHDVTQLSNSVVSFQCSASCGSGKVHRKVTCLGQCDHDTKPHTQEECHARQPCRSEWLTGRWTVCSHSCGAGVQSRTVECVVR